MTGYFTYQRGSRRYLLALTRPCMCSQSVAPHEWTEACDGFPPLLAEIDGQEVELHTVEHLITLTTTTPIQPGGGLTPAQEYAYLLATKAHVAEHGKPNLRELPPITP